MQSAWGGGGGGQTAVPSWKRQSAAGSDWARRPKEAGAGASRSFPARQSVILISSVRELPICQAHPPLLRAPSRPGCHCGVEQWRRTMPSVSPARQRSNHDACHARSNRTCFSCFRLLLWRRTVACQYTRWDRRSSPRRSRTVLNRLYHDRIPLQIRLQLQLYRNDRYLCLMPTTDVVYEMHNKN